MSYISVRQSEQPSYPIGAHIRAQRFFYWHHGIYAGDGTVIHFSGNGADPKRTATIRRSPIAEFANGGDIEVVKYAQTTLKGAAAVQRAKGLLGKSGYDLFENNCEHFCRWVKSGDKESHQVVTGMIAASVALVGLLRSVRL